MQAKAYPADKLLGIPAMLFFQVKDTGLDPTASDLLLY